ncbi:hypothetical protein HBI56_134720 [Parastagonospora nodorum]|nr:hypothetical protein HBH56_037820 [Parastagonospora nodorum]KAH3952785.1 hypothetical protein HBH53_048470 [Parastagonospora nodorum]KAH3979836.1 hypothetical protein HBH51_059470 [Parastagonospora nodorum]KAH4032071.1 hypothetical protein HBI13_019580 [Parastagonospora nodorum]KAH4049742.1 hypothetical protein HBH49_136850 [Parastagonospora nodorum]
MLNETLLKFRLDLLGRTRCHNRYSNPSHGRSNIGWRRHLGAVVDLHLDVEHGWLTVLGCSSLVDMLACIGSFGKEIATYTMVVQSEVAVVSVDCGTADAALELGIGNVFDESEHSLTCLVHDSWRCESELL